VRESAADRVASWVRRLTPSIDRDVSGAPTLARMMRMLPGGARVLVIAHGQGGDATAGLASSADVTVVWASMQPDSRASLIAETADLPFADATFDAVVARDVLNRVTDPGACVKEIRRVLRREGLVYAETPFMLPVHGGAHDFHRFTLLGHRYQFRTFEEIASGAAGGPGVAAAWSWRQFLSSLGQGRAASFLLRTVAAFTSFYWKRFDAGIIDRPRALDGAARIYFLGRTSDAVLTDAEWIAGYRGAESIPDKPGRTRKAAPEVFSRWAAAGRDELMARNHAAAVNEMLGIALDQREDGTPFSFIDAGCGNGWVVRQLRAHEDCRSAVGVDLSASMIAKARTVDPDGDYVLADLATWIPPHPVDLVHSMEVLYYLDDPIAFLSAVRSRWLKPGGQAVFGLDHYVENAESLGWPEWLGVRMITWPEQRWRDAMQQAGFVDVRVWRAAPLDGLPGTLAMLGLAAPG
jgi:SAM-dependent methyltransferase